MKISAKYIFSILLIFILSHVTVISQEVDKPSQKDLLRAAKEIMESAGTCALITVDKEGAPRARTMDPFPTEEDFTIWFGTNSESRKVEQIKNDSRVTLYYLDSDESGYVILYGKATLENDSGLTEKYWKKEWKAFYPNKSENYLLIKVTPIWIEVLSPPRGINNDTKTWQPPVVNF